MFTWVFSVASLPRFSLSLGRFAYSNCILIRRFAPRRVDRNLLAAWLRCRGVQLSGLRPKLLLPAPYLSAPLSAQVLAVVRELVRIGRVEACQPQERWPDCLRCSCRGGREQVRRRLYWTAMVSVTSLSLYSLTLGPRFARSSQQTHRPRREHRRDGRC